MVDREGRALGQGGTESGLGGAGTGRGEAELGSRAGRVCEPRGPFQGVAAADLGPGRYRMRLEIARALDPYLRRLGCPVLGLVPLRSLLLRGRLGCWIALLRSTSIIWLSCCVALKCLSGVPLANGGLFVSSPLMRHLRDPC